jgi:hypothetical protein
MALAVGWDKRCTRQTRCLQEAFCATTTLCLTETAAPAHQSLHGGRNTWWAGARCLLRYDQTAIPRRRHEAIASPFPLVPPYILVPLMSSQLR